MDQNWNLRFILISVVLKQRSGIGCVGIDQRRDNWCDVRVVSQLDELERCWQGNPSITTSRVWRHSDVTYSLGLRLSGCDVCNLIRCFVFVMLVSELV